MDMIEGHCMHLPVPPGGYLKNECKVLFNTHIELTYLCAPRGIYGHYGSYTYLLLSAATCKEIIIKECNMIMEIQLYV